MLAGEAKFSASKPDQLGVATSKIGTPQKQSVAKVRTSGARLRANFKGEDDAKEHHFEPCCPKCLGGHNAHLLRHRLDLDLAQQRCYAGPSSLRDEARASVGPEPWYVAPGSSHQPAPRLTAGSLPTARGIRVPLGNCCGNGTSKMWIAWRAPSHHSLPAAAVQTAEMAAAAAVVERAQDGAAQEADPSSA